ncbi:Sb-PDE family phosphodiesterase [Mangrovibacterium lignilyticum]|uniref:Sb-PDE family phosphodiesterase n=1 Tax=Mangrovibacterium lignilyticum TaxID=2668052 RepID=UPI0013D50385|nr:Sb-PDE family phosphodiesterase [Mangrovibacterium lignilyticum]
MKMLRRKGIFSILLVLFGLTSILAQSRQEIRIPDILGYRTLKCDFHMHTVFSDGEVWPTIRVQEAWREGLDVIAITDHIEYRPHSSDMDADLNRSYDIAKPLADQLGIVLIRGVEITRNMPPGHLNAIFVKNANLLEREDWWEACVEAKEQGAFVFWNHPGWKVQQPEETVWWPEHTRLLNAGILKGIEIYNHREFYPEALQWAQEKNLVILGNSDIHEPISQEYDAPQKRPLTLVFSLDKTENGIKSALLDNRTAVLFNDTLIGERRFLTPIFISSIQLKSKKLNLQNQDIKYLQVYNNSDIPFKLEQRQPSVGFSCPKVIVLPPNRTVSIELTGTSDEVAQMPVLKMFYEATNLITKRGEKLPVNIDVPNK